MTPGVWLQIILLSGLAGAVGQSARVVVGLKKLNDEADAKNVKFSDMFDTARLLVSLLIGFVAGVLAALALHPDLKTLTTLDSGTVLSFAAAGYAGTDFIEGIMSRYLPSSGGNAPAAAQANDFQG